MNYTPLPLYILTAYMEHCRQKVRDWVEQDDNYLDFSDSSNSYLFGEAEN